jgi:RNA polymerase sigma-70 factor (ECF subfamily)
MADIRPTRDDLYKEAVAGCGAALERLARAYELNPDKRRDLLQEIHVALWQSFENFEGRCSLKTWVYRVAHNTATSVVIRKKTRAPAFVDLEEVEASRRLSLHHCSHSLQSRINERRAGCSAKSTN